MSAPNKNYDPVEVTALTAEEVERAAEAALTAISSAKTLDELKEARIAHAGDKAPLSLARAEIGALPPQARADAGRRVGAATARVRDALKERQEQLELERDEQVLITERVDVTLPYDRAPQGARHPVSMLADKLSDVFVAMGYEVAEGPEVEAEWYNFDALNFLAGPPGPGDAGHPVHRAAGRGAGRHQVRPGAAHPHVARADPVPADPAAAAVRGEPGQGVPERGPGRHPPAGLLPDRGPGGR
jgi:hypothetical protein